MTTADNKPRNGSRRRRIFIVDDHPIVRERLRELIDAEPDLVVCGEVDDRGAALTLLAKTKPDLAIIDLSLKTSLGLELVKDLRIQHPKVRMLVFSMHAESVYAERAIHAGAHGYITKQEATRNILHAIRQVLTGEVYVSDQVARAILTKMVARPGAGSTTPVDLLTDRELEVFNLLGRGCNTRQMAERLGLSTTTIETYRSQIKEKLKMTDATALVQYAIEWVHGGRERPS